MAATYDYDDDDDEHFVWSTKTLINTILQISIKKFLAYGPRAHKSVKFNWEYETEKGT